MIPRVRTANRTAGKSVEAAECVVHTLAGEEEDRIRAGARRRPGGVGDDPAIMAHGKPFRRLAEKGNARPTDLEGRPVDLMFVLHPPHAVVSSNVIWKISMMRMTRATALAADLTALSRAGRPKS
jgi:hypothetical protein